MGGEEQLPKRYFLDESDPDVVVLLRDNGTFVAAFSARGCHQSGHRGGRAGRLRGANRATRVSAERQAPLASRPAPPRCLHLPTPRISHIWDCSRGARYMTYTMHQPAEVVSVMGRPHEASMVPE